MQIKYSLKYSLRIKKDAADEKKLRPLTIRVSYNGQRVDIPTGVSASIASLDPVTGQISPMKDNTQANAAVMEWSSAIASTFKEYEVLRKIPSPAELRRDTTTKVLGENVAGEGGAVQRKGIKEAFDTYNKENGPTQAWKIHTYKVFKTLWNDLTAFEPGISFSSLNEKGLSSFLEWLRFTKERPIRRHSEDSRPHGLKEYGLREATVKKRISSLKTFLRWADSKGYPVDPAYRSFRPRYRQVANRVIYLTEPEVRAVAHLDIPEEKVTKRIVRDMLIFACYTGLRFSDIKNLRKKDVHEDHIDVTTIKTNDNLRVDLNKVSKRILDRYSDYDTPEGFAIPIISNQKTNVMLKQICREAGIDSEELRVSNKGGQREEIRLPKYLLVSTHTGRRSFICNGLAKGIPVHIMMKWTGHSNYATMRPYIDAVDSVKAREMEKFNTDDIFPDEED